MIVSKLTARNEKEITAHERTDSVRYIPVGVITEKNKRK